MALPSLHVLVNVFVTENVYEIRYESAFPIYSARIIIIIISTITACASRREDIASS